MSLTSYNSACAKAERDRFCAVLTSKGKAEEESTLHLPIDVAPVYASVHEVQPLHFEEVSDTPQEALWDALMRTHHYLGYAVLETCVPRYSGKGQPPKKLRLKKGQPRCIAVSEIAHDPSLAWETVTITEGAKGPIKAQVARLRVIESRDRLPGRQYWLFLRRSLSDQKIKYAFSNSPANTQLKEMIRVSLLRWPIEQCFQEGKSEIGMDHYEHRSWPAWHRHMTFVFLAQLFLLRLRHHFKKNSNSHLAPNMPLDEGHPPSENVQQKVRPSNAPVLSKETLCRI